MAEVETPISEDPKYAPRTDMPTEEPTRLGDALPVVEGEVVADAPPRYMPGEGCNESVATTLAQQEDSPEAEMASHGAVGVSQSMIGEYPVEAPIGENVPAEASTAAPTGQDSSS